MTFGLGEGNDLQAMDIRCDEQGVRFRVDRTLEVFVPLLGHHTACNALAAIAVGRAMGVSDATIVEGLATAVGPEMRLQIERLAGNVTVINDAYNANPASMEAAIRTLTSIGGTAARRVAVLGDMLELGDQEESFHRGIGRLAAASGVGLLVCVGRRAGWIAAGAAAEGFSQSSIRIFANALTAAADVPKWLQKGDLALLKGSRGMELESIIPAIRSFVAE